MNEELLTVTADRSALSRVQEADPGDARPEGRIELPRFDAIWFVWTANKPDKSLREIRLFTAETPKPFVVTA